MDINFKNNAHKDVCDYWLEKISKKELVPCPFNLHVSSIFQDDVKKYLLDQGCYEPNFIHFPENQMDAKKVLLKHLKGTIDFREKEKRQNYRDRYNLKKIASNKDREGIQKILKKTGCCFVHQAYRYRIKNNYKEFRHLNVLDYSIVNELKEMLEKILMIFCYIAVVFCASAISVRDNSFYDLLKRFPKYTQSVDFSYLTSLLKKIN